jgi:hypothetical protein
VTELPSRLVGINPVGHGGGYMIRKLVIDLAAQSVAAKDIDESRPA